MIDYWIEKNLTKRQNFNKIIDSYWLKNKYNEVTNEYIDHNDFKKAMIRAGFKATCNNNYPKTKWFTKYGCTLYFNISSKSKLFDKIQNGKQLF